jgi:hypothetical protein
MIAARHDDDGHCQKLTGAENNWSLYAKPLIGSFQSKATLGSER